MILFDLMLLVVFVVFALLFENKASRLIAIEKALAFLFIFLFHDLVRNNIFQIVFSFECLVFLMYMHIKISGYNLVKLTVAMLSLAHSAVVVSYYLLPHKDYLTVYNSYPTIYLIIIALQMLGLWYGGTGQHNIRRWLRDDAYSGRRVSVLFNTCYK